MMARTVDDPPAAHEFLIVDEFLTTLGQARPLKTAFELGLIDRLLAQRAGSSEALGRAIGADPPGLRLLLDLLAAGGVIESHHGDVRLTHRFRRALQYRDLMQAKLDYAGFAMVDFADHFTALVTAPRDFKARARIFALFDYSRALRAGIADYAHTRTWMRITSTLTRYEAGACFAMYSPAGHRRMLDIGGNSGEFALQACRRNPDLRATVLDLPLVCEIGLAHVLGTAEGERIAFLPEDARSAQLSPSHDFVTFKSMLHDWPDVEVQTILASAVAALDPGGTLLIFERGRMEFRDHPPSFALLPTLLFARSYRAAEDYAAWLRPLGMADIASRTVTLDSPFLLVTARKP
jgi:O-methyltransferase domain